MLLGKAQFLTALFYSLKRDKASAVILMILWWIQGNIYDIANELCVILFYFYATVMDVVESL